MVAARGHRVQGKLCVGGFAYFKWRYLKLFIREREREGNIPMTQRINDVGRRRIIIENKSANSREITKAKKQNHTKQAKVQLLSLLSNQE